MNGDTILTGATGDACDDGAACGSEYVFRFNGTSWIEEQKLTASDALAEDQLGFSVSISGDTAIVGAVVADCGLGADCGAAYVYHFYGASWVETQQLTAFDTMAGDQFGAAIFVEEDAMVIGARRHDCSAGSNCGSAYIYGFDGVDWVEQRKLIASDGVLGDHFGVSVSLSGNTVIVGSFLANCAAGENCGSAYVFDCLSIVPSVSLWGLITASLCFFVAGTVLLRSMRPMARFITGKCLTKVSTHFAEQTMISQIPRMWRF